MDTLIKSMNINEIESLFKEAGIPAFRVKQLLSWMYEKGVSSYEQMTNLPKTLREQLEISFPISYPKELIRQESFDGTVKYLVELHDGATTEMVAIPSKDRLTVCVSSQSGCAMECAFCATGQLGLKRNLMVGEIVDQITFVQNDLGRRVSNVVMMGQGEPFSNFDNVVSALQIINNPKLLNIGARHITVSTCGLTHGIRKFANVSEQFTLAISLHSAVQTTRDKLMPKLENQKLDALKVALHEYSEASGRRFSFEYALMKGINDSDEELAALIDYCSDLACHINLIPLNEVPGSRFKPVPPSTSLHWLDTLTQYHIPASIRKSRGSDIAAACGQLATQNTQ